MRPAIYFNNQKSLHITFNAIVHVVDGSGAVTQRVGRRTCHEEVVGSTCCRGAARASCSHRCAAPVYTHIARYRSMSGDALRLGR